MNFIITIKDTSGHVLAEHEENLEPNYEPIFDSYMFLFDKALYLMLSRKIYNELEGNNKLPNANIHQTAKAVFDGKLKAPTIPTERKKMSNKELVDFLSEQFNVSRTSAKEMLHGLMMGKLEDNFKKQFSGRRKEDED